MTSRAFLKATWICVITMATLAQPTSAENLATPERLPRIGILYSGSRGTPSIEGVVQGLQQLGYRDGKNVIFDFALARGKPEDLPKLAKSLVDRKVRVIVAISGETLLAARHATDEIPIVSASAGGDFIAPGLIRSWDHPGLNVTGMNLSIRPAIRKRLEVLRQIMPSLSKLAVLVYEPNPESPALLETLKASAAAHGVHLTVFPIETPADLAPAIVEGKKAGANAVMTLQGPFFFAQRQYIGGLAQAQHIPLVMGEPRSAEAGALLQVNPDVPGCAARSVRFVDLIMRGAQPRDLKIETYDRMEIVVNLKAARDLQLPVDASGIKNARIVDGAVEPNR
jgi:putative ABC transport system substrate-binding protein